MFIGKKDEGYTFKDIPGIHVLTNFFKRGFYVALIIWMCGIWFSIFYEGSAVIRVAVIVVSLCIYLFFMIGKAVVESKFGK